MASSSLYDLLPFFKFASSDESFILSSGITSDYYVDLRQLQSYPSLIHDISKHIIDISQHITYHYVCGVPTAGVPYATIISQLTNTPMITLRKHPKSYGTGKMIEGDLTLHPNGTVLLIEDVTTTGKSIIDARDKLLQHGFQKVIPVVIFNRGCDVPDMISLYDHTHLDRVRDLKKYITHIRHIKKSRIIYSMDVCDMKHLEALAPYICGVKLHSDMVLTYNYRDIVRMSYKYHFIIIEDRKLADISKTNHGIVDNMWWADAITMHPISGYKDISTYRKMMLPIVQMSSSDNMISKEYTDQIISYVVSHPENVLGVIGQDSWNGVLTFTPGVCVHHDASMGGATPTPTPIGNQTYRNPKDISESNFIIVGSGLRDIKNLIHYL